MLFKKMFSTIKDIKTMLATIMCQADTLQLQILRMQDMINKPVQSSSNLAGELFIMPPIKTNKNISAAVSAGDIYFCSSVTCVSKENGKNIYKIRLVPADIIQAMRNDKTSSVSGRVSMISVTVDEDSINKICQNIITDEAEIYNIMGE